MNNTKHPENGTLHKCVCDISNVISALYYVEADPNTSCQPADLIKLCIKQLLNNVSTLNETFGSDWPENQE